MDIGPHAIWITPDGQWRLGGWGFSLDMEATETTTPCPYFLGNESRVRPPVGPRLTYSAPELSNAANSGGKRIYEVFDSVTWFLLGMPAGASLGTDIFSVGLLLGELLLGTGPGGPAKPLIECDATSPASYVVLSFTS